MERAKILSQMAQYDFSTPINASIVFDDSNDETDSITALTEHIQYEGNTNSSKHLQQNTDGTNDKGVNHKKDELKARTPEPKSNMTNHDNESFKTTENTKVISKSNSISVIKSPENLDKTVDKQNLKQNSNPMQEVTVNTDTYEYQLCQQINNNDAFAIYIKELLNTLSKHFIFIVKPYYEYYYKYNTTTMNPEVSKHLNTIKTHFFGLSYSTVVSLILPQEHNAIFIKKFIDKVVADTNKVVKWKCGRHFIEPLFYELIAWTKQKREYLKTLEEPCSNNEVSNKNKTNEGNRTLKEHLSQPPLLFNTPHTKSSPLSANKSNNINSNMCIFSTGTPGREVSINIDPETYLNHTAENNHLLQVSHEQRRSGSTRMSTPYRQTATGQAIHEPQQSSLRFIRHPAIHKVSNRPDHRRPPPPYGLHAFPSTVPYNIQYIQNQFQDLQSISHYQTQENVNPYTTTVCNYPNVQTYGSHIEGQPTTTPIITSVTSLRRPSYPQKGHCYVCAKITESRCKMSYKFYCSHLCQELDTEASKTACRNIFS